MLPISNFSHNFPNFTILHTWEYRQVLLLEIEKINKIHKRKISPPIRLFLFDPQQRIRLNRIRIAPRKVSKEKNSRNNTRNNHNHRERQREYRLLSRCVVRHSLSWTTLLSTRCLANKRGGSRSTRIPLLRVREIKTGISVLASRNFFPEWPKW